MQSFKLTAHVILTTLDYERLKIGLKIAPGYPVYVGYNSAPKEIHLEKAKEIEIKTLDILNEFGFLEDSELRTTKKEIEKRYAKEPIEALPQSCDTDQVKFVPLNFYNFEDALVELYGLFYSESLRGNQLVVNISGGTKPATIAATFAAALTGNATPIYFVGKKWSETEGGEVVPKGVVKTPITVGPLFDLKNVLPSGEEMTNIFLGLKKGEVGTIGELLARVGINPTKKMIAKYSYYLSKLGASNAVEMGREKIGLTAIGKMIARLVEKKHAIEKKHAENETAALTAEQ